MNHTVAKRLIAMEEQDQRMRRAALAGIAAWNKDMGIKNAEELKRIVHRHGWPIISLVGDRASHAAWLVVQHADHDPEFQQDVLQLMEEVRQVLPDEVSWHDIAYLTDRILVHHEKKPQWFGTQHYFNPKGKLVPYPIDNKKQVNKRRIEFGLETQAANTKRLNAEWNKLRG
jgi:hypothetical protein